jgi:hypothetical protein
MQRPVGGPFSDEQNKRDQADCGEREEQEDVDEHGDLSSEAPARKPAPSFESVADCALIR